MINDEVIKYNDYKDKDSEKVINMTPHDIHILDDDNKVIREYKRSDSQVRLTVNTESIGSLSDGTPLVKSVFGETEGLPEQEYNVYYIVSQIVKDANKERTDLLVPADVIRDDKGQIIGSKSLAL